MSKGSGKSKITDKNLYDFLEILQSSTEKEIRSAYRKKALKCHPDKNPDDPNAGDLFRQLSEAFEVLISPTAKAAYDQVLKGRELAKLRTKELDTKRRKLKEDLERREKVAADGAKRTDELPDETKLQREVERLKKEGSQTLFQEQEFFRQELTKQKQSFVETKKHYSPDPTVYPRLKVIFHKKQKVTKKALTLTASKYGIVHAVVIGKKSGIIEFETQSDAEKFYEGETTGENPTFLEIEWMLKGRVENKSDPTVKSNINSTNHNLRSSGQGVSSNSQSQNFDDFEAMVLKTLAAAAEKQKLEKAEISQKNTQS